MKANLSLGGKPMLLKVTIQSSEKKRVNFELVDPQHVNTTYQKRQCLLSGNTDDFYIRLPQSPIYGQLYVWEPGNESSKNEPLPYAKITEIKKLDLPQKLDLSIMDSPLVESFVKFIQVFAKKAGYLSAGSMSKPSVYKSNDGIFEIRYFDVIKDENGNPINTPARVNQSTGTIEVSKGKFKDYSVPMRMAILLHEFSHFWLNSNKNDEIEADLNALLIYLGLGYPRIDARNVFIKVFGGADTPANRERYKILDDFINNFENMSINITQSPSLRLIQHKVMGKGLYARQSR